MANTYKVLLPSPWRNETTGEEGTTWTVVGRAFPANSGNGFTVKLHANLSVTGVLVIKEDDGTDAPPPSRAPAGTRRRTPSAHQPFPSDGYDDDILF